MELILGSDTSRVPRYTVGPKDYVGDLVAVDLGAGCGCLWVLRWVEEREGTTYLQCARAPLPDPYSNDDEPEEYRLDACATGDLLTLVYRTGAKEMVGLATLSRVTRTAPSH